jgi:hypothetical protein
MAMAFVKSDSRLWARLEKADGQSGAFDPRQTFGKSQNKARADQFDYIERF